MAKLARDLARLMKKGLVLDRAEHLLAHAYDGGCGLPQTPDLVVMPARTGEVAKVLQYCSRAGVPVTPRGGGTSFGGLSLANQGGVSLVTTRLKRVLQVDRHAGTITLQPGILTSDLVTAAESSGFFFPIDPCSLGECTLGGNVATNAHGLRSRKYGRTADYLLTAEVVLPDGRTLQVGQDSTDSDYNLSGLLAGSKGTLAVITEMTLRLLPAPQRRRTLCVVFPEVAQAADACLSIVGAGIEPAAMEFLDNTAVRAIESALELGLPVEAGGTLLLEMEGSEDSVEEQTLKVATACEMLKAGQIRPLDQLRDAEMLWDARRRILRCLLRRRPVLFLVDLALPIKALPAFSVECAEAAGKLHTLATVFGHIGEGRLHLGILSSRKEEAVDRALRIKEQLRTRLEDIGGTMSGLLTIGLRRQDGERLAQETASKPSDNPVARQLCHGIKQLFDPKGILNPGVLPHC